MQTFIEKKGETYTHEPNNQNATYQIITSGLRRHPELSHFKVNKRVNNEFVTLSEGTEFENLYEWCKDNLPIHMR